MSVILIILGFILIVIGLAGCIIPAIPGPPMSFLALILLEIAKHGNAFTTNELIFWGVITIAVTALDYIIPVAGAKKFGATKLGIWGAVIGMIVGILFFPPFGMFLGAFLGAITGEMIKGKDTGAAIRAGWGTFVGTILGIGLKLAASIVMGFYYIKALV